MVSRNKMRRHLHPEGIARYATPENVQAHAAKPEYRVDNPEYDATVGAVNDAIEAFNRLTGTHLVFERSPVPVEEGTAAGPGDDGSAEARLLEEARVADRRAWNLAYAAQPVTKGDVLEMMQLLHGLEGVDPAYVQLPYGEPLDLAGQPLQVAPQAPGTPLATPSPSSELSKPLLQRYGWHLVEIKVPSPYAIKLKLSIDLRPADHCSNPKLRPHALPDADPNTIYNYTRSFGPFVARYVEEGGRVLVPSVRVK